MADLLTTSERAEILGAIQDVTDTFFKKPVTITQRRGNKIQAFNEDRDSARDSCDFELLGMWVPDNKDDAAAEAMRSKDGSVDDSEGILFFNYQDLKLTTPSLIRPSGEIDIIPNVDTLKIDEEERDIIGVNLVAPNEDKFYLVKIHYSNILNKEKPLTD